MKNICTIIPILLIPTLALILAPTSAMASDNLAGCEAVMLEEVMNEGQPTGAVIQTFAPAANILASLYDDEEGFLNEIDGRKVKAILCQRSTVIPSLRDFPILASGIPFALSNDFEAADSRSVTIFFKEGEFQHIFKGTELSEEEQDELNDAMEVFNLQPHDLNEKEMATAEKSEKTKEMEQGETDDKESDDASIEEQDEEEIEGEAREDETSDITDDAESEDSPEDIAAEETEMDDVEGSVSEDETTDTENEFSGEAKSAESE